MIGIGGSTAEQELAKLSDMTSDVKPIEKQEYKDRIKKATQLMQESGLKALYLNAGTNLYYFTGTQWGASERMVGAILFEDETLEFICPGFEIGTLKSFMLIEGNINPWEEHENPYALFGDILKRKGVEGGKIGMDESAAYFLTNGVGLTNPNLEIVSGTPVTAGCRMHKSDAEIAIIQQAKNITMEVHKAVARILKPGITADALVDFIEKAHIKCGIPSGSYFCIILFGEDSQYPHGVPAPRPMQENDIVLVDTGAQLQGYISDITRTYVYGTPSARQREIWELEKATQKAAFDAAQIGATCGSVDDAARKVLAEAGLSADYALPGLPHRVGHGTGLDIHEYPYLVRGNETKLAKGMVVSNEPMICMPGEFGIRHEDHFYMTDEGPKWFTEPMHSLEDPFGYEK